MDEQASLTKPVLSYTISKHVGIIMSAIAVGFDFFVQPGIGLLSAIPFVGVPVSAVINACLALLVWGSFYVWFKVMGVTMIDNVEKLLAQFGAIVFEVIPLISLIPGITFSTVATIIITRYHDKKHYKEALAAYEEQSTSPQQQMLDTRLPLANRAAGVFMRNRNYDNSRYNREDTAMNQNYTRTMPINNLPKSFSTTKKPTTKEQAERYHAIVHNLQIANDNHGHVQKAA